jgi:tetratricopeptide (TPR) repeat protein/ubiquinone/menaquinone biosynthesis C-methylase UbiE
MSTSKTFSVEEALKQALVNKVAGRPDLAETFYQSILQKDPQHAEAQKELHKLRKSSKKRGSNRFPKAKRKDRRVAKVKAAKAGADPNPQDIQDILSLHAAGPLSDAEVATRKLLRKFRHSPILYNMLGVAQAGQGKLDDAVRSYRRSLKLNVDFAEAHNNLGNALQELGQSDEAVVNYRRALKIRPDYSKACNNLGNALRQLGRREEAIDSYRRALEIYPDYARAHNNLGVALLEYAECDEAVASFRRALKLNPSYAEALHNFAIALGNIDEIDLSSDLLDLIIRCFERQDIDSVSLHSVSQKILKSNFQAHSDNDNLSISSVLDINKITRGLLVLHLSHSLITDPELELVLTAARKAFLKGLEDYDPERIDSDGYIGLLRALTYQGYQNEYLWRVSDDECATIKRLEADIIASIEADELPSAFSLYLLGAYRPLHNLEAVNVWASNSNESVDEQLGRVMDRLIHNQNWETEIGKEIGMLTSIDSDVSVAVQSQYDDNPYPRWESLSAGKPVIYTQKIFEEVAPHRPILEPQTDRPNVLVAGCGTGKQPIGSALHYNQSSVLAVDLSRKSLAFAKRKADQLGVTNIKFAQGDILNMGELDDRFDVIACSGVLHHMAQPEAGLKTLLELMNPGGFINIGVYSACAREYIERLRQVFVKRGFELSLEGIREFRNYLAVNVDSDARLIQNSVDFYSTSTLRDMLFDLQEHCYTIPQIDALLEDHQMEFLGFILDDRQIKTTFARQFPDDPDCLDLKNWHQFEQANPRTFDNMYQFWCRKKI